MIDMFNNETSLAVPNGVVIIPVSKGPRFLRIHKGDGRVPVFCGTLFQGESDNFDLELDAKNQLGFTIFNPTSCPVEVKLHAEVTPGAILTDADKTVRLKPHEQTEVYFEVTATDEITARKEKDLPCNITVNANFAELSLTSRAEAGLKVGRNKIRLGAVPQKPNFRIAGPDNLCPLDNSPTGLWQGPADCSANLFLSRNEDALHLIVETTDNVFCQPETGADCFKGDNLQLFLKIPGQDNFWEFGFSKTAKGDEIWTYRTPSGFKKPQNLSCTITQKPGTANLKYDIRIPFAAVGLKEAVGRKGFRINAYINDNDGNGRRCYMGIYTEKDPSQYPMVFFK